MKYQKTENIFFTIISSPFKEIGLVWYESTKGIKLIRIVLSKSLKKPYSTIRTSYPDAVESNPSTISRLTNDIRSFLDGKPINFSLRNLDQSQFKTFQKKVILLERKIPRGWVSTYGRLAHKLGYPQAARGIGQALARNPFPIIIPCHRTVRGDGSLGGYIGGLSMKRKLLEFEGIKFDLKGRVVNTKIW